MLRNVSGYDITIVSLLTIQSHLAVWSSFSALRRLGWIPFPNFKGALEDSVDLPTSDHHFGLDYMSFTCSVHILMNLTSIVVSEAICNLRYPEDNAPSEEGHG